MHVLATDPNGSLYHAYLNGERISTAVEADTVKGYVVYFVPDPDRPGHCRMDANGMVKARKTGKVELVHVETGVVVT